MPTTSVTIASASAAVTASNPVVINWRSGLPVLWQVTVSSSVSVGDFTIQYTLDDIQQVTYSASYGGAGSATVAPTNLWAAISSSPNTTVPTSGAAGVHFTSSTIFPDGISGSFLAPPCALRLYSTATSSGILTLRVVQGDGR